jgi:hypothetical protein
MGKRPNPKAQASRLENGSWWLPIGGFELLDSKLRPVRGKSEAVYLRRRERTRHLVTTPLFDAPELAATFAEIEPGDALAVLAFANQHGFLGIEDGPRHPTPLGVERLSDWYEASQQVRATIELLEAAGDPSGHARLVKRFELVRRERTGPVLGVRLLDPFEAFIEASNFPLHSSHGAYQARPRELARLFAQNFLNSGLKAHTAARAIEVRATGKPPRFVVQIGNTSLLGCVWIQIGWLAEGAVEHRRCAWSGCRGVFVVEGGVGRGEAGGRGAKRTCSNACRTALSRARTARKSKRPKRLRRHS